MGATKAWSSPARRSTRGLASQGLSFSRSARLPALEDTMNLFRPQSLHLFPSWHFQYLQADTENMQNRHEFRVREHPPAFFNMSIGVFAQIPPRDVETELRDHLGLSETFRASEGLNLRSKKVLFSADNSNALTTSHRPRKIPSFFALNPIALYPPSSDSSLGR